MKILVTGGSSDIAKAIVTRRFQMGDSLTVTASTAEKLAKTLAEYGENPKISGIVYDLQDASTVGNITEDFDGVILNAASRNAKLRKFHEWDVAEMEEYLATNVTGNLRLLQKVLPKMVENKFGRIIFISSLSVAQGTSRFPLYCASKAALEGLILNLAVDYGANNIFSNIVRPGIIATERTKKFWKRSHYLERVQEVVPARALGQPEQVAEVVDPLLSKTSYMNGSILTVSGGLPLLRTEGLLGV
jgi:3-oxoacyl-[acyl-carrier protein] reductase